MSGCFFAETRCRVLRRCSREATVERPCRQRQRLQQARATSCQRVTDARRHVRPRPPADHRCGIVYNRTIRMCVTSVYRARQ